MRRTPRPRVALVAGALGLTTFGALGTAEPATAEDATSKTCAVHSGGPAAWPWSRDTRAAFETIEEALKNRFYPSAGEGPHTTGLARGLIGWAADYSTRTIVVVVDPGLVVTLILQDELRRAVDRVRDSEAPKISVRVQGGCHGAAELYEVFRFFTHEYRLMSAPAYTVDLAVRTATWVLCDDNELATAVARARYGELVAVRPDCVLKTRGGSPPEPSLT